MNPSAPAGPEGAARCWRTGRRFAWSAPAIGSGWVVRPTANSWSCAGAGPASRFHASSPSNMNACGNIRIATLFAKPNALVTSNSEIQGNDRTSWTSPFARMSSTAVIDHSVGTSRRRSFVPSKPTEKTRVIWLWEIPWSYRSVTASPARRSVSETRSSTRRGTDGFDVSSTFAMSALGPLGGARTENGLTREGFFVNHISVSIGFEAIAAACTVERIESGARASATRRGAFPRTSVSRNRRISASSYESHDSEASRIDVSSSRTGGTRGPTRTFGYPHEPTNALGGDAPNRFVVCRSRRSSNQSRTRPRYGQMASRHRLVSPRQTWHAISRRTSARLARNPSSAPDDPVEPGTAMVRRREWAPRVWAASARERVSLRRPRPTAHSQSDTRE